MTQAAGFPIMLVTIWDYTML